MFADGGASHRDFSLGSVYSGLKGTGKVNFPAWD